METAKCRGQERVGTSPLPATPTQAVGNLLPEHQLTHSLCDRGPLPCDLVSSFKRGTRKNPLEGFHED